MWGDPPPWSRRLFTAAETAERIRAFATGYGLDDVRLVSCVRFAAERSYRMAELITLRAETDPAFAAMRDEGHAAAWAAGGKAIEENLDAWLAAL